MDELHTVGPEMGSLPYMAPELLVRAAAQAAQAASCTPRKRAPPSPARPMPAVRALPVLACLLAHWPSHPVHLALKRRVHGGLP